MLFNLQIDRVGVLWADKKQREVLHGSGLSRGGYAASTLELDARRSAAGHV